MNNIPRYVKIMLDKKDNSHLWKCSLPCCMDFGVRLISTIVFLSVNLSLGY